MHHFGERNYSGSKIIKKNSFNNSYFNVHFKMMLEIRSLFKLFFNTVHIF